MAPSTSTPEFDLSAALEDAEGRELADAIIARKKYRNIMERFIQQMVWGDVHTDGHGNVIPRQEPEHWASIRAAAVEGGLMTHETGWRSRLLVGGRGFGKRAAQIEALRKWNFRPEAFIPHKAPDIGEVRWFCKRPTAPVYAVGTNGWAMEQALALQSPFVVEHNRKLNARYAAKVSAIHDILGVTQHGSND